MSKHYDKLLPSEGWTNLYDSPSLINKLIEIKFPNKSI